MRFLAVGLAALVASLCGGSPAEAGYHFVDRWVMPGKQRLTDMAVDSKGHVYIITAFPSTIRKFTAGGKLLATWGGEGEGDGKFDEAETLAVDLHDNVYVGDINTTRIQKFTSNGQFLTSWTSGPWLLALDVDTNGNVYKLGLDDVVKYSPEGVFAVQWPGEFFLERDLAVGTDGGYYINDDGVRMLRYNSSGVKVGEWGSLGYGPGQFKFADSIATDGAGHVLVADTNQQYNFSRVQKFSPEGVLLSAISGWGRKPGQLYGITAIATGPENKLYVADKLSNYNNRVNIFSARPNSPSQTGPRAKANVTRGTKGKTVKRKASFRFESDTAGASFRCRLTGKRVPRKLKRWKKCSSPKRYKRLKPGKKTFHVRAVSSGKVGPVAKRKFRVVRKPSKPKPEPGPKPETYVVKVEGSFGKIQLRCALARGCEGSITIKRGKTPLVKRRKYSIKAYDKKYFRLKLTAAGLKALQGKTHVRATGTLIGKSGAKLKIIAILKR